MKPTEILSHEHEIVLLVLGGAEREAQSIKAGREPDKKRLHDMIDFFRVFVDRCHHSKEERCLFPRVIDRGMPSESGPIPTLIHEHEEGRKMVAGISQALAKFKPGDKKSMGDLWGRLTAYSRRLRDHVHKEDRIFFPMAEKVLTDDDRKDLIGMFDKIELHEMGAGTHEKYHQLAQELAERK